MSLRPTPSSPRSRLAGDRRGLPAFAALGIAILLGACASSGSDVEVQPSSLADAARPDGTAPLLEMEITNRAFVEWYLSRIGQATEELVVGNPSVEARREASAFRFMQGTSAYAIAAGPNAYVQLLDLVALITLAQLQWNDEGLAVEVFQDRAPVLQAAIGEAHGRVWERAERYMTPDEIAHLEEVIRTWRTDNPDLRSLSFVRMTEFAHELAVAMETFREDRGIFGRMAETNREIDEARLLGERALYLMERSPLLLGWRMDAVVSDLMTHPEVADTWDRIDGISLAASGLDQRLGRLEALFAELPDELVLTLAEETRLREALSGLVELTPLLAEVPGAATGIEASLARIVALADRLEATYSPDAVRGQVDVVSARAVAEARGLILLAAACGAGLILLYFGLAVATRKLRSPAALAGGRQGRDT